MGKIRYEKRKITLNFLEDKPSVFKMAAVSYPTIPVDDLLKEVAHAENVNETVTQAVIIGLLNRICHYVNIGHGVSLGKFGTFKPVIRSKCTKSVNDADASTVTAKVVRFYPGTDLKEAVQGIDLEGPSDSGRYSDRT